MDGKILWIKYTPLQIHAWQSIHVLAHQGRLRKIYYEKKVTAMKNMISSKVKKMTFKTVINFQHPCLKNILTKILFLTGLTLQLSIKKVTWKTDQKRSEV